MRVYDVLVLTIVFDKKNLEGESVRVLLVAILALVSVGLFAVGSDSGGLVYLLNIDDGNPYGMVSEYKIVDNKTGQEIAFLSLNTFVGVVISDQEREVKIRLITKVLPAPDFVQPALNFTLDRSMLGKKMKISRSYKFGEKLFHLDDASDKDFVGPLEYPDKTVAGTPAALNLSSSLQMALYLEKSPSYDISGIRSLSKSLTPQEKENLFHLYKEDPATGAYNIFPGLGIGSYIERDYPFAASFTVGELGSASVALASGSLLFFNFLLTLYGPSSYSASDTQNITTVFVSSSLVYLAIKAMAITRGYTYPGEYNNNLRNMLDMPPNN